MLGASGHFPSFFALGQKVGLTPVVSSGKKDYI